MVSEELELGGVRCLLLRQGEGGPVFFWGVSSEMPEEIPDGGLAELVNLGCPYTVLVYRMTDWNRNYSPWCADAVMGEEAFAGGGPETLSWLSDVCIPWVKEHCANDGRFYTIGYSLSGLFALWVLYEKGIEMGLSGAASCSGSLWFAGFDDYRAARKLPEGCAVYLSLGGKEERTKNAVMATIGDRTRELDRELKKMPEVRYHTLVMNPGGHFADSVKRVAGAVRWLGAIPQIPGKNDCH